MSLLVASGVGGAYVGILVGLHRWNVWRRRRRSGGFPALERLDWDALLEGLAPPGSPNLEDREQILLGIATGLPPITEESGFREAGYGEDDARWLTTLARVYRSPESALARLEQSRPGAARELYLREYLRILHRLNPVNLEVSVFAAKRRLGVGLARFGDQPCLYYARALASSRAGLNRAAIDDLGRAVYFSRQAPFYCRAVLDTPFLQEARPELVFRCREAPELPLP